MLSGYELSVYRDVLGMGMCEQAPHFCSPKEPLKRNELHVVSIFNRNNCVRGREKKTDVVLVGRPHRHDHPNNTAFVAFVVSFRDVLLPASFLLGRWSARSSRRGE